MERMYLYVMIGKSRFKIKTEIINVRIANHSPELKQTIGTVLLICVIMPSKSLWRMELVRIALQIKFLMPL